MIGPERLEELALSAVVTNIDHFSSLDFAGLPQFIVGLIFVRVVERSLLTPRSVELFRENGHPDIKQALVALIRPLPAPDYSTTHRWLG